MSNNPATAPPTHLYQPPPPTTQPPTHQPGHPNNHMEVIEIPAQPTSATTPSVPHKPHTTSRRLQDITTVLIQLLTLAACIVAFTAELYTMSYQTTVPGYTDIIYITMRMYYNQAILDETVFDPDLNKSATFSATDTYTQADGPKSYRYGVVILAMYVSTLACVTGCIVYTVTRMRQNRTSKVSVRNEMLLYTVSFVLMTVGLAVALVLPKQYVDSYVGSLDGFHEQYTGLAYLIAVECAAPIALACTYNAYRQAA